MRSTVAVALVVLLFACKKDGTNEDPLPTTIVGSWQSGLADDGYFISFTEDHKIVYNFRGTPAFYPFTRYKIENDSTLLFYGGAGTAAKLVKYKFKEPLILQLEDGCFS
ncbi:MAG: hypothetical protein EOP49_23285, partial [Sphingobacteriales bacterium]